MTGSVLRPDYGEMLKLSEFAATLGISTKTARRWITAGKISAVQTPGGHWRVPASQLAKRELTTSQFARLVGVHPVTVRRWCRANKITHSTTFTGLHLIPMSEVPRLGRRRRTR
jgi:excisionase family DNA binding protein